MKEAVWQLAFAAVLTPHWQWGSPRAVSLMSTVVRSSLVL